MRLVPITRSDARRFIAEHHRHAKPPSVCVAQVGLEDAGKLVGVGMLAQPRARMLCDGETAEIIRVATNGARNGCSMLYGALCRVASGLGYRRVVTYTLASEGGASLRASGFSGEDLKPRDYSAWSNRGGARHVAVDLFGNRTTPDEPKRRWWRDVA